MTQSDEAHVAGITKEQLKSLKTWLGQGHAANWRSDNKAYNIPGILHALIALAEPIAAGTHVIVPKDEAPVFEGYR